ncbi:DNA-processing protein DprA [uncultured Proteiniphilum sp.]|uniref:DNA-processing protein DprA n=1 Tax=uncultured Proteiniphilum sp. TaxID=497637 RepID=UPI002607AC2E|nr:DNA-processing protein DprA [uncultured Proteiniphilum sp.]
MNGFIDNTYWIAVAHLPKWTTERTNRFIIQIIHEKKMSWADFFELDKKGWKELFAFTEKELSDLELVKSDMPRLAFIAEQLQNEGFQIIAINSPDYPVVLKENLKIKSSPPVLYIKGRKGLLQEDAVAIVGSRKAGAKALEFTNLVAKKSVKERKVVVSGFAKGVDKQALDSAIKVKGKSIIVLPQGILTFQSGFKKYYEPIVNGDVLVLSAFFPKAGWDVGLAMTRNAYIYGLAKEIYVAESDSKGGTWEGVMDGLKRERRIYVRYPESGEKNANVKLVELGALPVNMKGEVIDTKMKTAGELFETAVMNEVNEPTADYENDKRDIEKDILDLLSKGTYTSKEILLALKLDWDSRKLSGFLKKNPNVKTISGRPAKYTKNNVTAPSLF